MARVNPRLQNAESPYLEEAAEQPVDWYAWGEDAFQRAKDEGKPVLVDSGAVWCHWCHVMDHESYDDPETANVINERFIPIKLDRDERPDIDKRLQQAVGAITGRGGWPLTAFLTPDGDVFYGGTYYPREPQGGMPAFKSVLRHVAQHWNENQDAALEQAAKLNQALQPTHEPDPNALTPTTVTNAIDEALTSYDPAHGGFGNAPKFPHTTTLDLLLAYAHAHPNDERAQPATKATLHTLESMSQSGLYDHLDGGYHRYSVDAQWHVPHFEKMLYDNAQLLHTLTTAQQAAQRTNAPETRTLQHAAQGTARFLMSILEQPQGGYGGSQDADRRPTQNGPLHREDLDDGSYFTWTLHDVNTLLDPDDARLATLHYGITKDGDMPEAPGQNVLRIDATPHDIAKGTNHDESTIQERLETIQRTLHEARQERETPFVDPTVYTDWNALAITAMLRHAHAHHDEDAEHSAMAALDRILDAQTDEGFHHAHTENGARIKHLVDDHAQMIPALIEAYHATQDPTYLDHAQTTADTLLDSFIRDDGRLRTNANADDPAPQGDSPTPSPSAQTALHLPRLARLTGERTYHDAATRLIETHAAQADKLGAIHGGTLHQAIHAHHHEPPHIVITGHDDALWDTARTHAPPLSTILHAPDPKHPGIPQEAQSAAQAFENEPTAIVCQGGSCQAHHEAKTLQDALTPA